MLNRDTWLSAGAVKEKQHYMQACNQRISFDLAFVSIASSAQGEEELELCGGQKWLVCGWVVPTSGDVNSCSVADAPIALRCSWYMCASTYIEMAFSLQRFMRSMNCCACLVYLRPFRSVPVLLRALSALSTYGFELFRLGF